MRNHVSSVREFTDLMERVVSVFLFSRRTDGRPSAFSLCKEKVSQYYFQYKTPQSICVQWLTSAGKSETQKHLNKLVIFRCVHLHLLQANLFFWPVSEVQDDLHSAQCRKSSHIRSSVSDSCRVLSESWVLRLEHLELQLVPDLGTSCMTGRKDCYFVKWKVNLSPSVWLCVYLHSVVFLVVVCILAVPERTFTIHSFNSPAESAVGCVRILLTRCLIWCWLLKYIKHVSQILENPINYHYFCRWLDGSPYCCLPASVLWREVCECVSAWRERSSTPRQPCSANHIAARGAGAPPRCCDWSPGHPATRSRCPSPSTCQWTAWIS